MWKTTRLITFAVCATVMSASVVMGAHLVDGTAVVVAGSTNAVTEKWLAIEPAVGAPGVGIVRAVLYTVPSGVTNGIIRFYAYDAGVKRQLYAAAAVLVPGTGSYDMGTNVMYSGKIRVEVYQASYTNAACTWAWAAIVE